jgi:hypothetical protein
MTGQQPHLAPQPNHSTGPKTPEGKSCCRLNAYRHGLTGQLRVFAPEEQQAYEKHCKIVMEALSPVGDFERNAAQSIADDYWRLKRARAIEASTFALGQHVYADTTGYPGVDAASAQARTWEKAAHNLQLLTVYEQHIPAGRGQEHGAAQDSSNRAHGSGRRGHETSQTPVSISPRPKANLPAGGLFHRRPRGKGASRLKNMPILARESSDEFKADSASEVKNTKRTQTDANKTGLTNMTSAICLKSRFSENEPNNPRLARLTGSPRRLVQTELSTGFTGGDQHHALPL